jgi:hypothetical protein
VPNSIGKFNWDEILCDVVVDLSEDHVLLFGKHWQIYVKKKSVHMKMITNTYSYQIPKNDKKPHFNGMTLLINFFF